MSSEELKCYLLPLFGIGKIQEVEVLGTETIPLVMFYNTPTFKHNYLVKTKEGKIKRVNEKRILWEGTNIR